jgi:hypothetical protein
MNNLKMSGLSINSFSSQGGKSSSCSVLAPRPRFESVSSGITSWRGKGRRDGQAPRAVRVDAGRSLGGFAGKRSGRKKAWVLVRNSRNGDYSKVRVRSRRGDQSDSAGVCVTIVDKGCVDSIRPIENPGSGFWAPREKLDVRGIHWVGSGDVLDGGKVSLSRAVGPFHESVVLPRIRQGGEYIAPAYAKNGSITDTQLCVSGGVNYGEEPKDAAVREIREELGLEILEIRPEGGSFVDRKGVEHFMFLARV